jgi:hypothetical protein
MTKGELFIFSLKWRKKTIAKSFTKMIATIGEDLMPKKGPMSKKSGSVYKESKKEMLKRWKRKVPLLSWRLKNPLENTATVNL